jgi:putative polyhydroxyalkanoate system protein
MSELNYSKPHNLGLERARELAKEWTAKAGQKMGLEFKHEQGVDQDTITFERSGVKGEMVVTANNIDLNVKLGMMMAAFKPMIEAEIAKNMDKLMARATGQTGQA